MEVLVDLKGACRTYTGEAGTVHAVREATLKVSRGEFVSLIGPSGCGKSTLLHLIGGMDRTDAGEVWIDGEAFHGLSEEELTVQRRRLVGFVFQFFYLLPTLTILQNVELPCLLAGQTNNRRRAEKLLEHVGLGDRLRARPSSLSGGEMQRVALARALVNRPALVIADEPTGNLDSGNGRLVLQMLHEVTRAEGATVIMATHNTEAAYSTDRILRMKDGRLLP